MLSLPILQCLHNQLSLPNCSKLRYQYQLPERHILSAGSDPWPDNYRFHHTNRKWLRNQRVLPNWSSLCYRHILPVFRQLHDELL
jgi:hypothetical protein